MASAESSSIIARLDLNDSDYSGLYRQVSIFLNPFADLVPLDSYDPTTNAKKEYSRKKKKTVNDAAQKELRTLAKQYLSFLLQTLKLLPSIIQNRYQGSGGDCGKEGEEDEEDQSVTELLCVYKLVLDCLQCIMPCLVGKFYKMHLHRSKLVSCLEVCGKYVEAETMALSLLESLASLVNSEATVVKTVGGRKKTVGGRKVSKSSSGFIPIFVGDASDHDPEVAVLLVEIVKRFIRCAYKRKAKDGRSYYQVIAMVEELQSWLIVLDTDVYVKYRSSLANDLYNCALSLAMNSIYLDVNLVQQFCRITLRECLNSSLRDHLPKISRRICFSFDLKWEDRHLAILDMLKFYIESILCKYVVDEANNVDGFFEFIYYCAEDCSHSKNVDASRATFKLLSNAEPHYVKVLPTVISIMNLYAAGLCFTSCNNQTNHSGHSDDGSTFSCLLDSQECLLCLSNSLEFLKLNNKISEHQERKNELSTLQVSKVTATLFSSFNALVFACKLLAEHINRAWKDKVSQENVIHCSLEIPFIQDIFLQFGDLYFQMDRSIEISLKQREKLKENRGSLLQAAIAALRIFFRTERNKEKTVTWIMNLISSKWIESKELKFLGSSLYNIGASLHDMKQIEKASVAFLLTFTAVWAHAKLLCQIFSNESKTANNGGLSEDSVKDVIADACLKSASIFYVLCQCDDVNVLDLIVDSLLSWAAANSILKSLISPKDLVRAWVKVVHKDLKEGGESDNVPLIYSFLSSHITTLSKKTMGMILEQEFFAYEEIVVHSPNICEAMQQKIIDILLHHVYATKEYFLQRAKIFVLKGKTLRSSGINGLNNCIQCLSEAIILLNHTFCDPEQKKISHHLLAVTYCLHALCAHEANQDLEVILHDIRSAIDLWSNLDLQGCSIDDQFDVVKGNTLHLLFNVYDLMSLKGILEFQTKIHKLIIILWKLKSVSLESCIAMLWSDRRLNHLLCPLVVGADTINSISYHFDIDANSFNIWLSSLKDMPSASLGLVQKLIISDAIMPQVGCHNPQRLRSYKVTTEEIEATASSLSSSVPLASHSAFSAAYLYYDLSERVSLDGRFYEALKYAKRALVLRKKILLRKFIYLSKQQCAEDKHSVCIEAVGSVVTEVWPHTHKSLNLEQTCVNPWNVLRCYLESTLQVAFIHEKIGEGAEAEYYLKTGKSISISYKLHFCEALFACHLGKVYCKKQQYDLAKNELDSAESALNENEKVISCKYCKLALEVTVDMRRGDLSRCLSKSGSHSQSSVLLMYKSTLEKLSNMNLEVPQTLCDRRIVSCSCSLDDFHNGPQKISAVVKLNVESDEINTNKVARKRSKNSSRLLRSNKELSYKTPMKSATSQDHSSCSETLDVSYEENCSFDRSNCWKCFLTRIAEADSMLDMIYQKWECHRRRLLLKLLSRIGICTNICSGIHNVHKCFLQSMSLLFMRDPYCQTHSISPYPFFTKLIEEECSGDIFTIERAVILHDMSVFFVKNCLSENSRTKCCYLSDIQLPTVISWLLRAFMLTCDFPLLFQKISQLLATLFLLSSLGGNYSFTDYFKSSLSISQWAAYFHQASLGTALRHKHLSIFKEKTCNSMNIPFAESAEITKNSSAFFRIVPEKLVQLEEFVKNFFASLPSLSVICISFLEGDYINVLGETMLLTSFVPAWLLLSRLNSDGQPIVILLPVDFVHEESRDDTNSCSGFISEVKESAKEWHCPWGHSVVDDVAPHFKLMLGANYLSMVNVVSNSKWWSERKKLDNRLSRFLRCIEDLWLGPWRCLFLGERSYPECFDKLMIGLSDLNCKSKFDINQSLLKLIIGGSSSLADAKECFHQLFLYGGYFGRGECAGEGRFRAFSTASNSGEQNMNLSTCQLILDAFNILQEDSVDRDPIMLVLDADIQMLPWENLPVLRKQEVYRMPSVGSILMTLDGRNCNKGMDIARSIFPLVDTMNTYYLVNPSGDFTSTQVEFEEWFRDQKWEGKAGSAPAVEELSTALQNHDLYIYFGHGSGTEYISTHEIGKMKKCAACFLMGCGSGCLFLKGRYAPQGPSLSFLFAGSPVVIANLWEVSDRDIDRFSKAMISSWVEDSNESNPQWCTCINVEKPPSRSRKTRSSDTRVRSDKKDDQRSKCAYCTSKNKKRITSFMSKARDTCKLPFLIGASPVCYGVPTIIKNTINLD